MGIDPAPFWANLYLYHYEEQFISKLITTDKARAKKFLNASRFIDDECNLNDYSEFSKSFSEIYPPELQLKCEHEGLHATFLDLDISVVNGLFVYKLFNKRDDFPSPSCVCQILIVISHRLSSMEQSCLNFSE